ncbi:hypothetical protein FACS189421_04760 [Bacteroidia bacterium]|nr:hypothetical protein FACS189421_04760 [Bacteroidia bacterium]GHT49315.1 hypothetical protein FACS189440_14840 [Bacteroidia bacterium]
MNTVTAKIDISRPSGRRIVRELEKKRTVKIEYPFVGKSEKTYSLDEVFDMGEKIINNYFGTELKISDL